MGWLVRELAALLAPPRCAGCSRSCAAGATLCPGCVAELRRACPVRERGSAEIDEVVSAAEFSGAARRLVHGLKYGRRLALALPAAEAIARACDPAELLGAIVPVPASPLRWLWRGFDPAEEIALALARITGLPVSSCLRRSQGPRQVGRSRQRRLEDPPRVRAVRAAPSRVLLLDDVRTTGATLAACGRVLRGAGAREVTALTLAYVGASTALPSGPSRRRVLRPPTSGGRG